MKNLLHNYGMLRRISLLTLSILMLCGMTSINAQVNYVETTLGIASDGMSVDRFGSNVAISNNYAIVGAYGAEVDTNFTGAAYIYERNSNGEWIEEQKLSPSDIAYFDQFGISVDVSGEYAIVGAYTKNGHDGTTPISSPGAAYIFQRNVAGVWNEIQKLEAHDKSAFDWFGESVSISGDYAIVGADREDHDEAGGNGLESAGSAYIYERNSSNVWVLAQKVAASDRAEYAQFGFSVSISGENAIIGSPSSTQINASGDTIYGSGAAYIFNRSNMGIWSEVEKLNISDMDNYDFAGFEVSISGSYAVVGYSEDEDPSGANYLKNAGGVGVFEKDGSGNWLEVQKLVASDRDSLDVFGHSVDIFEGTIVVGAFFQQEDIDGNNPKTRAGMAYIFQRDDVGVWNEQQRIVASDRDSLNNFGEAVAVTNGTVLIGSDGHNLAQGAAYFFENQPCDVIGPSIDPTLLNTVINYCPGTDITLNTAGDEVIGVNELFAWVLGDPATGSVYPVFFTSSYTGDLNADLIANGETAIPFGSYQVFCGVSYSNQQQVCQSTNWIEMNILESTDSICLISGIEELQIEAISLYPIPSKGTVTLTLNVKEASNLTLTLTDMVGKTLSTQTVENVTGAYKQVYNIEHLPNGMYFLEINDGKHKLSKKVLLSK